MFKPSLIALLTCSIVSSSASLALAGPAEPAKAARPAQTATTAKTSGRATIKGVDYYYELRGQGEPLLILHGGLGSILSLIHI